MRPCFRWIATMLLITIFSASVVWSGDWPKDYVVWEGSTSPDGRLAVLVQTQEAATDQDTDESSVYLADVKNHSTLGEIDKANYFEHQNHRSLLVYWAPDSSYCLVQSDSRFGVDTISLLEIKDSNFKQTQIDERIQKSLDALLKKQSHDKELEGDVAVYFRLGNDRKIKVRATSQNNPKRFPDVKTYYALFQGTYDLAAGKWTVTDARSTTAAQDDFLATGFQKPDFENITYGSDDDRAKSLDEQMNSVYQAIKFILPPARFAKVKQEQTEWLKKRDAASSIEEKCKMMETRIKALQDFLW